MLKRSYLFFVCVFILSPLMFFTSCEVGEDKGEETIKSEGQTKEETKTIKNFKGEITPTKTNEKLIGDILVAVKGAERINKQMIGINLYLENQGTSEEYISGNFTAMDTETKKVLEQNYPYENGYGEEDIINLNELPEGSNWEGKIFFATTSNKITLLYNDFMGNKKKYNIEIMK